MVVNALTRVETTAKWPLAAERAEIEAEIQGLQKVAVVPSVFILIFNKNKVLERYIINI